MVYDTRTKLFFVLGANDPEMQAIEHLLRTCHQEFRYMKNGVNRVTTEEAYYSTNNIDIGLSAGLPTSDQAWTIVFIECGGYHAAKKATLQYIGGLFHIDHHQPTDPGYGRPPEDFMLASSLGQAISLLARFGCLDDIYYLSSDWDWSPADNRWQLGRIWRTAYSDITDISWYVDIGSHNNKFHARIPRELVMTAAADHCLLAAYKNKCPGVSRSELIQHRVKRLANKSRSGYDFLFQEVNKQRERVHRPPAILTPGGERFVRCNICPQSACETYSEYGTHAGQTFRFDTDATANVADFTNENMTPYLKEAACIEGVPCIFTIHNRNRVRKVSLVGASPTVVKNFMSGGYISGLHSYYGDPLRGFAGGYVGD